MLSSPVLSPLPYTFFRPLSLLKVNNDLRAATSTGHFPLSEFSSQCPTRCTICPIFSWTFLAVSPMLLFFYGLLMNRCFLIHWILHSALELSPVGVCQACEWVWLRACVITASIPLAHLWFSRVIDPKQMSSTFFYKLMSYCQWISVLISKPPFSIASVISIGISKWISQNQEVRM